MSTDTDKKRRVLRLIEKQFEGMPGGVVPTPEEFTCNKCKHEPECASAWDMYNTGGDCLESK